MIHQALRYNKIGDLFVTSFQSIVLCRSACRELGFRVSVSSCKMSSEYTVRYAKANIPDVNIIFLQPIVLAQM